jgi:hypothetical protein
MSTTRGKITWVRLTMSEPVDRAATPESSRFQPYRSDQLNRFERLLSNRFKYEMGVSVIRNSAHDSSWSICLFRFILKPVRLGLQTNEADKRRKYLGPKKCTTMVRRWDTYFQLRKPTTYTTNLTIGRFGCSQLKQISIRPCFLEFRSVCG